MSTKQLADSQHSVAVQLAHARAHGLCARIALASARTQAEKRAAREDIEFWGNKAAFFASSTDNPGL